MAIFDLKSKLEELLRLPAETERLEFKHNHEDPQEIGEYLSAISKGVALKLQEGPPQPNGTSIVGPLPRPTWVYG